MKYTGRVIPGRGEGRKLGFPTLNLGIPAGFDAEPGVYAGWVWMTDPHTGQEEKLPAAFHYGGAPTFGIKKVSLEAHIIDRDIPTPPEQLSFELVEYLRPVQNFDSPESLAAQIGRDVGRARDILKRV